MVINVRLYKICRGYEWIKFICRTAYGGTARENLITIEK